MLNNEAVDDVPVPDGTVSFTGGLAALPPRAALAPNQFRLGSNTMIEQAGHVIQTRRGFSYLGSAAPAAGNVIGLGYLETTGGVLKRLLGAWSGGTCQAYDGAAWGAAAGYTPVGSYFVDMVQGVDVLYVSDGTQNMHSWNGVGFTDLGNAATDPPRARFLVWGTNRLIAAGVLLAPDTVYFSNFLAAGPGNWPVINQIRVGAGNGDPITGLAMWTKTLLAVFTRTKTYIVNIDPASTVATFTIDEVPGGLGCVNHRTIAKVGTDLWFLSNDGVRSLSRVLQGADTQVGASLSLPIENLVRAITDQYHSETSATFFRGRYLFAGQANYPNPPDWPELERIIFSYNKPVEQWEGRWLGGAGFGVSCWAQTKFGGNLKLVCGGWNGNVLYWRHPDIFTETADDYEDDANSASQPIATRIGTRGHTFGAEMNAKQGLAVEVEFDVTSTADTATVKVNPDEGADATLSSTVVPTAGKVPLTLLHQPPFRALAVEISSTAKKLAVRSVKLSAFMNTMPVGS